MNNLSPQKGKHSKTYRHSGFALIEVLLASLVLTVGVLAFMKLQNISLQTGFNSYARTQGLTVIQSFIANLRANTGFADLPNTQTDNFILGGTITATNTPQTHPACQSNTTAKQCADALLNYQRYLISQQMQTALPTKNSLLCYQQDNKIKGFIRVDFFWLDDSTKIKMATLSASDCPSSFHAGSEDEHKNHQITIYAQL